MLRPWTPGFSLCREGGIPLGRQLFDLLREDIRRGRLAAGEILPGSRQLARQLGVNRKTVVEAFDELAAQGWLRSEPRRGMVVTGNLNCRPVADRPAPVVPPTPRYILRPGAQDISPMGAATPLVFSDGEPDPALVPYGELARVYREALTQAAREHALGYGDPQGYRPLRQALAAMLRAERGLGVDEAGLCLVRGSQMGIFVAARLLLGPGDHAAMEVPGYPGARAAFLAQGARVHGVPVDGEGLCTEPLAELCQRQPIKLMYLTPHHQFPTTVMMSASRRLHLLELAQRHGFAVVEDDYDHEFHYGHRPTLPLASLDGGRHVLYIGSLSKVLAPGLRVGYLAGPPEVMARAAREVALLDRQGNVLTDMALARFMASGGLTRHLRRVRRLYAARREAMLAAMTEALAGVAGAVGAAGADLPALPRVPEGGLALWWPLSWAGGLDQLVQWRERALAAGVGFPDSRAYYPADPTEIPDQAPLGIRLGFASLDAAAMVAGVQGLLAAR